MNTTPRYQVFDSELSMLSAVRGAQDGPDRVTQRELARRAGISLGMANLILRRLAERGLLELTRLSAKRIKYGLTPAGMKELGRRTAGYYRRVSWSAGVYRDRLDALAAEAMRKGAEAIVLVGASEVEFLLAEACERHGIVFLRTADPAKAESLARRNGAVLVLSESLDSPPPCEASVPCQNLAEVLAAPPAEVAEGSAL